MHNNGGPLRQIRQTVRAYRRRVLAVFGVVVFTASMFAVPAPVQAGVSYAQIIAPMHANVGESFTIRLYTKLVKDEQSTGQVSGTISYPADMLELINVSPADFPAVSVASVDGKISVTAPSKGAGNGYDGYHTLMRATFSPIATGNATFAAGGGAMRVNGSDQAVIAATTTIYASDCAAGQAGDPPGCYYQEAGQAQAPVSATPQPYVTGSGRPQPAAELPKPEKTGASVAAIVEQSRQAAAPKATILLRASLRLHDVKVSAGLQPEAMTEEMATAKVQDDLIIVELRGLTPATAYHYRLTGRDTESNDIAYTASFVTDGYPVSLALDDGTGKTLAGRSVVINDVIGVSDARGVINLLLPAGAYMAKDLQTGATREFQVLEQWQDSRGSFETQSFTLGVDPPTDDLSTDSPISAGMLALEAIAVLAIGVIGFAVVSSFIRKSHRRPSPYPLAGNAVHDFTPDSQVVDHRNSMPGVYPSLVDLTAPQRYRPRPRQHDPFLEDSPFAKDRDISQFTKRSRSRSRPRPPR
ncbi:hypothetical protein CR970_01280 [Candidatus Saccharibacteria bacterium]|nr:MAG: hypothetical protein CR970_01280 [Candidatus Saccharibacteria bacterium]